jgi:hypothetical protein
MIYFSSFCMQLEELPSEFKLALSVGELVIFV